jgi:hypothetical protein
MKINELIDLLKSLPENKEIKIEQYNECDISPSIL